MSSHPLYSDVNSDFCSNPIHSNLKSQMIPHPFSSDLSSNPISIRTQLRPSSPRHHGYNNATPAQQYPPTKGGTNSTMRAGSRPPANFAHGFLPTACRRNFGHLSYTRPYPRAAAPLFFCTCLHVFRRLATRFLATPLLFCCATTMRALDLRQDLSTEQRFASWLTATCQFCPTDICQLHPVEISLICLISSLQAGSRPPANSAQRIFANCIPLKFR